MNLKELASVCSMGSACRLFAIAVGVSAVAIAAAALPCNDWLCLLLIEYLLPPVDAKLF